MGNRLVYVEPNDIVKDHIQATNTNSDYTWNPEDLSLYVDLQVIVPNRSDCGEEPTTDTYNNTYVSLMEGVKIGNSKALTTDYINVSYNEIKNNNVSSKEALGITSIDITFDAHFYPRVQINFTDVRAYSLFMPEEEQYKEGLKNEAHEAGKYNETGRAYTNFFSAVFHFPYPRFLLTVKGFYGTKVTFVLAVDTFKSSFNSNTGNFDVSISFIGYMYGIYTEIPMSYIACAPYVEPLAESSEDGFVKSKYWVDKVNDGTFKTIGGETIPTFLEFAKKYATTLNNSNEEYAVDSDITELNNINELLGKLQTIKTYTEDLVDAFGKENGNKVFNGGEISEPGSSFFYFTHNTNTESIKVSFDKALTDRINNLIDEVHNNYSDLLDGKTIPSPLKLTKVEQQQNVQNGLTKVSNLCKEEQSNTSNNTTKTVKLKDSNNNIKFTFTDKDSNNQYNINYDINSNPSDKNVLINGINNILSSKSDIAFDNLYFCAINHIKTIQQVDVIINSLTNKKNSLQESATDEAIIHLSASLGFTPSIQNIFRMVFAHLECFFHVFLDETIYKIKDEKSTRTLKNLGLSKEDTDIKFLDKEGNAFVPPFFALFTRNQGDGTKTIAYPGNSTNYKLTGIHEVQLINKFLKASERFRTEYNTIKEAIEALSETLIDEELDKLIGDSNNTFAFSTGFESIIKWNDKYKPMNCLDVFYGDRNPYSYLDKNSNELVLDILYLFYLRLVSFIGSVSPFTFSIVFIDNNVGNFLFSVTYNVTKPSSIDIQNINQIFTNISADMFKELNEGNIIERLKNYSKNRCYPITDDYSTIPNDNFPVILSFNVASAITTQDASAITTQDASTNQNGSPQTTYPVENTPKYLNGVHIIGDGDTLEYFVKAAQYYYVSEPYHGTQNPIRNIHDFTYYIANGQKAADFPWHQIYRYSFIDTDKDGKGTLTLSDIDTNGTKVNQFPSDSQINEEDLTLPFILCGSNTTLPMEETKITKEWVSNMLVLIAEGKGLGSRIETEPLTGKLFMTYLVSFKNMTPIGKSFFILSGLIVDIKDIFNSDGGFQLSNSGCMCISKTRKIVALYLGCLMYLVRYEFRPETTEYEGQRKPLVHKLIYKTSDSQSFYIVKTVCPTLKSVDKYPFCNRGRFDEYYTINYDKYNDTKDKAYVDTFLSNKIRELFFASNIKTTSDTGLTVNSPITKLIPDELTHLEEFFLHEVDSGILREIMNNATTELGSIEEKTIDFKYKSNNDTNKINTKEIIRIYPLTGKTSASLIKLMSETVTIMSTKIQPQVPDKDISIQDIIQSEIKDLFKKLLDLRPTELTVSDTSLQSTNTDTNEDGTSQLSYDSNTCTSLYYTFKSLYDKWICSYGNMNRFSLGKPQDDETIQQKRYGFITEQEKSLTNTNNNIKREINNFVFLDSLYRDIGKIFVCDPVLLINSITMIINGESNVSVYQFLHKFCQDNKLMMRAVPVYNNFYTQEGLKEIFTPRNVFNTNEGKENNFASTYLIMYTHEPSKYLADTSSNYINDGMDIGRTIVTTDTESLFSGEGYVAPTFGVTYGMQNQSYFKGININMDNPITTDYSIANTLHLANNGVKGGDLNLPIGIGQNIYSIYSNRSYNCVVEMMGCANIMPMMYFQLNNIPMFKGVYMITSVKHSIRGGNMTTTFTGVRQTSIIYPFINRAMILSSVLSRISSSGIYSLKGTSVSYDNPYEDVKLEPKIDSSLKVVFKSLLDVKWKPHKINKYPLRTFEEKRQINTIVLHYTAGTSSNSGKAEIYRNSWNSQWNKDGNYEASADFAVDDGGIVQYNPNLDHFSTFATADNKDKINIEMCSQFKGKPSLKKEPNMPQWSFSDAVKSNTIKLILELYHKYGKELNIIRHYDIPVKKDGKEYKKPCPGIIGWNGGVQYDENGNKTDKYNNSDEFVNFKNSIKTEWDKNKPKTS